MVVDGVRDILSEVGLNHQILREAATVGVQATVHNTSHSIAEPEVCVGYFC